jgi:hypothetical protein
MKGGVNYHCSKEFPAVVLYHKIYDHDFTFDHQRGF